MSNKASKPSNVSAGLSNDLPFVTRNKEMKQICNMVSRIAKTDCSVFISGESGTGKELIAQMLYKESLRKDEPFFVINCGAIPRDIVDSELFGHEKGAFTGAVKQKKGFFEIADNGTLFMDEVTEMSMDMQVKLLRVVEYNTFRRVGGEDELHADIRFIAATNRRMEDLINENTFFRKDLFYRLSVVQLEIPPLRQRKDDIPLLANHFLSNACQKYGIENRTMDEQYIQRLMSYPWPGNIRQLKNVIEQGVIMCPDEIITCDYLSPELMDQPTVNGVGTEFAGGDFVNLPIGSSVEEAEKMLIEATMTHMENNKSKAAKVLGISRKTLHNKLDKYTEKV